MCINDQFGEDTQRGMKRKRKDEGWRKEEMTSTVKENKTIVAGNHCKRVDALTSLALASSMCCITPPAATLCPDPQDSLESTLERLSAQEKTSTCITVTPLAISS